MRGGQRLPRAAASFVVPVAFVGLTSAFFREPNDLPRWLAGLSEAIRFSPVAVAIFAGSLWVQRSHPVWPGLIVVAAYTAGAEATGAWLSERGPEYAIRLCLTLLPISLGEFLLLRWLLRRDAAPPHQPPTPWQPQA